MVTDPVNSSAWAETSGDSRQGVPEPSPRVPPQNVGVANGPSEPAAALSNAWALLTPVALAAVCTTFCCQLGIVHDSEMPPPLAPHAAPSFQTCSAGGCVASSIVVPPTET